MKISRQEVLDIAKANGFSEEEAEKLLVVLGKRAGSTLIDLLKLVASKTSNSIDDMLVAAGEPTARRLLDELQVDL